MLIPSTQDRDFEAPIPEPSLKIEQQSTLIDQIRFTSDESKNPAGLLRRVVGLYLEMTMLAGDILGCLVCTSLSGVQ